MELSIILPVFNEVKTLPAVISLLAEIELNKVFDVELIVVDDGSADGSGHVAVEALRKAGVARTRVVVRHRNEGKGVAVRIGLALASGTIILTQDADQEYNPHDIAQLVTPILEGKSDVVFGSRFLISRTANCRPPFFFALGNKVLTAFCNFVTGLNSSSTV
jgi:glycosyltransferase involved in cell wall biosynthesis